MKRIGVFEFRAPLWRWEGGQAAWHFVSVPPEVSDDVAELTEGLRGGFGSVRVAVTIGGTSWRTSVFPSKSEFMLPVKKAVRAAEGLEVGQEVTVRLELMDL